MSRLQTFTVTTFHKHNPDWNINLYMPIQEYSGNANYVPDYTGEDYFPLVTQLDYVNIKMIDLNDYGISPDLHNILRSDILRYHMLYNFGGVWSDFDVLWLRPMEHLPKIVGHSDFNVTICMFDGDKVHSQYHHNISILVSSPKHPFYRTIIDRCNYIQSHFLNELKGTGHQAYGTVLWNEMLPEVADLLDIYPDMVKLDYATFFPYSIFEMGRLYNQIDLSVLNDRVMCVHWFNGHTLSKDYINNNKLTTNCSMTTILKNEDLIDQKQIFTEIYERNLFRVGVPKISLNGSRSGVGSDLITTKVIRKELPKLFEELNIKRILDAPCGDFNWMKELDLSNIEYTGMDIVEQVVKDNQEKYSKPNIKFMNMDIIEDIILTVDIILCRDYLVHLTFEDILKVINNFKKSKSTYLMTTTYPNLGHKNKELTGIWRPLNLERDPFNFPKANKYIIEEINDNTLFHEKTLALWCLDQLPSKKELPTK